MVPALVAGIKCNTRVPVTVSRMIVCVYFNKYKRLSYDEDENRKAIETEGIKTGTGTHRVLHARATRNKKY